MVACAEPAGEAEEQPERPAEFGCPEPFSSDRVYAIEDGPADPDVWTARDVDDASWTCTFAASRGAAELQVRPADGALIGVAHEGRENPALALPPATQIWKVVAPEALVFGTNVPAADEAEDWYLEAEPENGDELLGTPCGDQAYVDHTLIGADGVSLLAFCVDPSDSWDVRDLDGNIVYDLADDDADPMIALGDGRLLVDYGTELDDYRGLLFVEPGGVPVAFEVDPPPGRIFAVRRIDDDAWVVGYDQQFMPNELRLWRVSSAGFSHEGNYDLATFEMRGDSDRRWALDGEARLVGYFDRDPASPGTHASAIVRLSPDGTWSTIRSGSDVAAFVTGARLRP
jgi:hypothetical protein